MNKLVNFFNWNIHPVISRDVALQFKKVSSHVVDVDKGVFFVDVMLGDVDVEMIESVLVQAGLLTSWANVAGHGVRKDCTTDRKVLPNNFAERRMLSIWNVVEKGDTS